jgi:hypothetical protein
VTCRSTELASLPEFDERTLYVVTGLLLPIWDRLPGIDNWSRSRSWRWSGRTRRTRATTEPSSRVSLAALPISAFAAAWSTELASLPEFDERTLYVVTGLLLPIWDRHILERGAGVLVAVEKLALERAHQADPGDDRAVLARRRAGRTPTS